MSRILSQSECDELSELVTKVERSTAGELVTVVLRRSDPYTSFRLGWAVAIAMLLTAGLHLVLPDLPSIDLLGAQALCLAAGYALFGRAPWLGYLVPRRFKQQAVSSRAKRLFLDLGVTETRDRSGVLILLSELERRVEILGDRGIHEHLGAEAWKALVDELVGSIRGGRAVDGLRTVIHKLGRELAIKFPPRADDTNELPNHVIMDE